MKTITITNQKGGLGKTCISTNISRFLSEDFNKKVLFVDFDVQANASETLKDFNSNITCYDLISRDLTEQEINSLAMATENTNLVLIKASNSLANSDSFDKNLCYKFFNLNMAKLNDKFDFMVIDTPPTLGNTLTLAFLFSEYLIIPLELDSFALMGLQKLLATYQNIKKINNKLQLLGIVINKFYAQRKRQLDLFEQINEKTGGNGLIFNSKIHPSVAIQDALSLSCSLRQLRKKKGSTDNRAINEFYALTYEVIQKLNHDKQ